MVKYAIIVFAGLAAALPLNINLGAYSPALVVGTIPSLRPPGSLKDSDLLTRPTGDGEISFGGKQDVSNLITALEGAAVNAAAGAAAAGANNAAAVATVAAAGSPAPTPVPVPVPNTVEAAAVADPLAEQVSSLMGGPEAG